MAGVEMKPGRFLSLLTGVALLGAIAAFNEMTPDAQASLLSIAAETARSTALSWLANATAALDAVTGTAAGPPERPAATGDAAPQRRIAARTGDAAVEPPPAGNPLWTLPLKQLSMTRERPIFSPSRRPPPPPAPAYIAPVAVRQPAKAAEPERPTVSLLGTIIGASAEDRIGLFLEKGTQNIVRLRAGEDHQGWVLRLIKAREVTLVKDGEQAVVLELPAPGDAPPPGLLNSGPTLPGVPGGAAAGAVPGMPQPANRQRRQGR
jgi:hypothetical protein